MCIEYRIHTAQSPRGATCVWNRWNVMGKWSESRDSEGTLYVRFL